MRSIVEACQPRADILTGSFNLEIFTASLSHVMDCYRGQATSIHTLYTDAEQFFRQATYPTEGLCMALAEVFGRLAGDNSVPAIHRLETAFGGGKTHTLIALTHLGFRGHDLAAVTRTLSMGNSCPHQGTSPWWALPGMKFRCINRKETR
jgi:hypothetical protein